MLFKELSYNKDDYLYKERDMVFVNVEMTRSLVLFRCDNKLHLGELLGGKWKMKMKNSGYERNYLVLSNDRYHLLQITIKKYERNWNYSAGNRSTKSEFED